MSIFRSLALLTVVTVLTRSAVADEPVASRAPDAVGMTATIILQGSTGTYMPCSYTQTLDEKSMDIEVNAKIGYTDESGAFRIYPFHASKFCQYGLFTGTGFTYTFQVFIPGARSISGINGNGRVVALVAYGIHGHLSLYNDGAGSSPSSVLTITTHRTGSQCSVPGATTYCGLGSLENRLPAETFVPDPPPPSPPPSCYYTYSITGGTMLLGLATNQSKFSYPAASNACGSSGGHIPSLQEITPDFGNLALPTGCIWLANPAGAGHYVVFSPGGQLATTGDFNSCYVVCRRNGCESSMGPAPVAAAAQAAPVATETPVP